MYQNSNQLFALNTDFSESTVVLGALSQVLGVKTEQQRVLPAYAEVDSDNKLREIDPLKIKISDGRSAGSQGAEVIMIQSEKKEDGKSGKVDEQPVKPVDIGIVITNK